MLKKFFGGVLFGVGVLSVFLAYTFYENNPDLFRDNIKSQTGYTLERIKIEAEQGDKFAQYNLGLLYSTGEDVPQDYKLAAHWYEKAAKQGLSEAQNNLGVLYDKGLGVLQDYEQAIYWYKKAAMQNIGMAQRNLAIFYFQGIGVSENLVLAHAWANLAASNNDDKASELRDRIALSMKPQQIVEARKLAKTIQNDINSHS